MVPPTAAPVSSGNRKTALDRTVVVLLADPDATPSRHSGVAAAVERLNRCHGVSIVYHACQILSLFGNGTASRISSSNKNDETSAPVAAAGSLQHQLVPVTASVLLHRYFHQVSMTADDNADNNNNVQNDVWSIAMACTLLATKIHEVGGGVSLYHIILAFVHVYRKRILLYEQPEQEQPNSHGLLNDIWNHPSVAASQRALELTNTAKKQDLILVCPSLSPSGPVYKEWHNAAVQAEGRVLRQLGFYLYWIPDSHPHWFVPHFVAFLLPYDDTKANDKNDSSSRSTLQSTMEHNNDPQNKDTNLSTSTTIELERTMYRYCDLASRLDLCVRLDSAVIACAALYCAAIRHGIALSPPLAGTALSTTDSRSRPWWHVLCGRYTAVQSSPSGIDGLNIQPQQQQQQQQQLHQNISDSVNALFGMDDDEIIANGSPTFKDGSLDVIVATRAFIPSFLYQKNRHNTGKVGFLDPGSFVWEILVEASADV